MGCSGNIKIISITVQSLTQLHLILKLIPLVPVYSSSLHCIFYLKYHTTEKVVCLPCLGGCTLAQFQPLQEQFDLGSSAGSSQ